MATKTSPPANPYGNFAVSGSTAAAGNWCAGCGRKLAVDGRCERCDAWHASPLVQVGAPLVAATTVIIAFLVGALHGPAPVVSAAAPPPSEAPSLFITAPPVFQPTVITASAPPAVPFPAPAPLSLPHLTDTSEPPAAGFAELERLRSLSRYVDATLAAADVGVPAPTPHSRKVDGAVLSVAY